MLHFNALIALKLEIMFYRQAVEDLKNWYKQPRKKPLVIRGARQVGKTTAVRLAAQELGVKLVEINLERHSELNVQFQRYQLDEILFSVSLITGETIKPDSPLILFLDEAQATPAAYSCLRYFYEDMPNLAVILTGSLLDQVLQNYQLSSPVGRIEPYFMGPLHFDEFLLAIGAEQEYQTLNRLTLNNMHLIPDSLHQHLLTLVRRYTLTGGMPYCVQLGIETHFNHADILKYQVALLQTYRDDFAKYSGSPKKAALLNAYFKGILAQIGRQFSHKQAQELAQMSSGDNRQLNLAIERFIAARLFCRVLHSSANAVPLGAETKIRISKFLFIDIGLLLAARGIPAQSVMDAKLELAGKGELAEQWVGQQLLYSKATYINPELYYWHPPKSEGQAEIDYLYVHGNEIIPVEVKSGSQAGIKSLHSYVIKKQALRGIRISSGKPLVEQLTARLNKIEREFELINLPFYLLNQIERLLS
jgi:predicted AAA+ superfamily ATPase